MRYDHKRSDERIKRHMGHLGMPNSMSLYQALKQLEMEVRLECEKSDDMAAEREIVGDVIVPAAPEETAH